jgi:hypothetical protein
MVWKSNLDENDQEFIEDFGAKTGDAPGVPQPSVPRKTTAKKPAVGSKLTTAKKNGSPTK